MPRPRFFKLDEHRRRDLLERATAEFVRYGYRGASLNRLLEAADLSKGTFYYYFDDRDDLFGAVLGRFVRPGGAPEALLQVSSSEDFWLNLGRWMESLHAERLTSPADLALGREVLTLLGAAELPKPIDEVLCRVRREIARIVEVGQRVGAVRVDLESDLLFSLVVKLIEAMDFWAAERGHQAIDTDPRETIARTLSLLCRLLTP